MPCIFSAADGIGALYAQMVNSPPQEIKGLQQASAEQLAQYNSYKRLSQAACLGCGAVTFDALACSYCKRPRGL